MKKFKFKSILFLFASYLLIFFCEASLYACNCNKIELEIKKVQKSRVIKFFRVKSQAGGYFFLQYDPNNKDSFGYLKEDWQYLTLNEKEECKKFLTKEELELLENSLQVQKEKQVVFEQELPDKYK